jgi:flagellar biosynthesis anti-sigma factor FlgM
MKIYERNLTGMAASEAKGTQEAQKTESSRTTRAQPQSSGDRVEFSGSLGALSRAVSSDQGARSSRIHALTAAVQNGTYQPDSAAIGRSLVAEALAGR